MSHFNLERELAEQSPADWRFGGSADTLLVCQADGMTELDRIHYLPPGEVQMGKEDTMDCATRSPINTLATKFTWLYQKDRLLPENKQWLVDNGYVTDNGVDFSDAFVAINAHTTREGNSLKSPLEAIRKQGLVPKHLLPLTADMTFDDYHNPARITPALIALGAEFTRRFTINYQQVDRLHFPKILVRDMIGVAGFAWPAPVDGEYPATDEPINHAFMLFAHPMVYIFDNYFDDDKVGDFTKKLASDYRFFSYGYRVVITSNQLPTPLSLGKTLGKSLFVLLVQLFSHTY